MLGCSFKREEKLLLYIKLYHWREKTKENNIFHAPDFQSTSRKSQIDVTGKMGGHFYMFLGH
jgi:hypothetical protein